MAVDISGLASGGVVNFVQYGPGNGYYHSGGAEAAKTEQITSDAVTLSSNAQALVAEQNSAAEAALDSKIANANNPANKDELSKMLDKSDELKKTAMTQQLQASSQQKQNAARGALANINT
ncbi:MAG: hypothetical protein J0L97_09595 [Alphaproteobacteria bacterium]|nr:hypothetical protein [Alphaproteobacteria bacterium]